jgi:putative tryptophan/tyrosine transport system substrate-binding protein
MGSGTAAAQSQWTTAFVQHLRELGWTEGRNVTIEYRWAEGRSERFAEIAAEFVRRKVDLILTHNTPPTLAAKQATATIAIVFATAGDPVESGIVTSLGRPGGNVTGLSSEAPDTAGKKIELLRQLVPGLRQLAILSDVGNPFATADARKIGEAAHPLGLEVAKFEVHQAADIDSAFEALKSLAQALYVIPVPIPSRRKAAGCDCQRHSCSICFTAGRFLCRNRDRRGRVVGWRSFIQPSILAHASLYWSSMTL